MSNYNVSNRYANALLYNFDDISIQTKVAADMNLILNTMIGSRELRQILASPVIKTNKKLEILNAVFESRIQKESMNFLKFVVTKNREDILLDITQRFIELWNSKIGLLSVKVYTAHELNTEEKVEFENKLKNYTGKNVSVRFFIKKEILGGFLIQIGDTVIDASITNQLRNLKHKLLQENVSNK